MARAQLIIEQLLACRITHVVSLPDNASKALLEALAKEPKIKLLSVTREGEAWAIACGLWMGGATPTVVIQNTGFFESGDALRGTALRMKVPLLCLLTYRGYASLPTTMRSTVATSIATDGPALARAEIDSCAVMFEPTLRAWGVAYDFLHDDGDEPKIRVAFEAAQRAEQPVALLITRDTT